MVTARDVARRAGVSDTIVSIVLKSAKAPLRCSQETREKVLRAARDVGYRHHPLYTAMRTGRTHIIGLYLADPAALLNHPHAAYSLANVQVALTQRGYSPLIAALNHPEICDFRLMDGLIVLDCRRVDTPLIEKAARALPTFGWFGTPCEPVTGVYSPDRTLDQVRRTNHEIAAKHLYDLGHRQIALIEPDGGMLHPALSVFDQIAKERGLAVKLDEVFDRLTARTYPNAMQFLDRETLPTALYALDDEVAHRIIEKLSWRGLAVPRDISVFSRQTDMADAGGASTVTGIYTDWPAVWQSLVHQYVDVIEGKRTADQIEEIVPAQRVVERTTCTPPRA